MEIFNMFKRIKIKKKIKIKYILFWVKEGINIYQDFFILFNNSKIKIYDNSDHVGGKLISKNNKIVCYNWEFLPGKEVY